MSNEFKDWFVDVMTELNDKMWETYFIPDGWVNTFITDMKIELANVLGSYVDDFIVRSLKEKYGVLRIYWTWKDRDYDDNESEDLELLTKEIEDIISKYENISKNTCVVCGESATKMTTGWIVPVCDNHEYL